MGVNKIIHKPYTHLSFSLTFLCKHSLKKFINLFILLWEKSHDSLPQKNIYIIIYIELRIFTDCVAHLFHGIREKSANFLIPLQILIDFN